MVDMDPRWVRKLEKAGRKDEIEAYVSHVLQQAKWALEGDEVAALITIPPLLRAMIRDHGVDVVRRIVEVSVAGRAPKQDPAIFALRSSLVHEWRKFLFTDPGFPAALLPPDWPGHEAARVFDAESARLLPGASRFVDCCLRTDDPGSG